MISVLSVASPFAPVGRDANSGNEQTLTILEGALVRSGHSSVVVATEESRVAGLLFGTPKTEGEIDLLHCQRVWETHRNAIEAALRKWSFDVIHFHDEDFLHYLPASLEVPAVTPDDVVRISRGIRIEEFPFVQKKSGYVAVLGRIRPEKEFHHALDAAWMARTPLLLAGGMFRYPEHEKYFRDVIAPRLDSKRRFLGPISLRTKLRLLSHARCVLVPGNLQSPSRVAMEALACGTPVIGFRGGSLSGIVENGKTGFLVSDTWEMARAIDAVGDLNPMDCRQAAEARFSADRMVDEFFQVYEQCLLKKAS